MRPDIRTLLTGALLLTLGALGVYAGYLFADFGATPVAKTATAHVMNVDTPPSVVKAAVDGESKEMKVAQTPRGQSCTETINEQTKQLSDYLKKAEDDLKLCRTARDHALKKGPEALEKQNNELRAENEVLKAQASKDRVEISALQRSNAELKSQSLNLAADHAAELKRARAERGEPDRRVRRQLKYFRDRFYCADSFLRKEGYTPKYP